MCWKPWPFLVLLVAATSFAQTPTPTPNGCCVCYATNDDVINGTPSGCFDNQHSSAACAAGVCAGATLANFSVGDLCTMGCRGQWPVDAYQAQLEFNKSPTSTPTPSVTPTRTNTNTPLPLAAGDCCLFATGCSNGPGTCPFPGGSIVHNQVCSLGQCRVPTRTPSPGYDLQVQPFPPTSTPSATGTITGTFTPTVTGAPPASNTPTDTPTPTASPTRTPTPTPYAIPTNCCCDYPGLPNIPCSNTTCDYRGEFTCSGAGNIEVCVSNLGPPNIYGCLPATPTNTPGATVTPTFGTMLATDCCQFSLSCLAGPGTCPYTPIHNAACVGHDCTAYTPTPTPGARYDLQAQAPILTSTATSSVPSATATPTWTSTPTWTRTRTPTSTPSRSPTITATPTWTPSPRYDLQVQPQPTHTFSPTVPPILTFTATASPTRSATPSPTIACCGDCNGDHVVTADEVNTCLSIVVGALPYSACPADDCLAPFGTITTLDCVTARNIMQFTGCPGFLYTPTPLPVLLAQFDANTPGPTNTPTILPSPTAAYQAQVEVAITHTPTETPIPTATPEPQYAQQFQEQPVPTDTETPTGIPGTPTDTPTETASPTPTDTPEPFAQYDVQEQPVNAATATPTDTPAPPLAEQAQAVHTAVPTETPRPEYQVEDQHRVPTSLPTGTPTWTPTMTPTGLPTCDENSDCPPGFACVPRPTVTP